VATDVKHTNDGHLLFVILAALLAVLNVLWAVIAPFVLTIPSSAAAIAVGIFAARRTGNPERRVAITAAAVSATVLVLSLGLLLAGVG
jgi:CHASE2 domain-containing sensor protein